MILNLTTQYDVNNRQDLNVTNLSLNRRQHLVRLLSEPEATDVKDIVQLAEDEYSEILEKTPELAKGKQAAIPMNSTGSVLLIRLSTALFEAGWKVRALDLVGEK